MQERARGTAELALEMAQMRYTVDLDRDLIKSVIDQHTLMHALVCIECCMCYNSMQVCACALTVQSSNPKMH